MTGPRVSDKVAGLIDILRRGDGRCAWRPDSSVRREGDDRASACASEADAPELAGICDRTQAPFLRPYSEVCPNRVKPPAA